jgi:formylglycine-generating enzyme required for sulfatase activity
MNHKSIKKQIGHVEEFEVVSVNKNGEIFYRQKHHCTTIIEDLGGGHKLEMVEIPGGMFKMGTSGFSPFDDEKPSHQVRILSFLMSKYPITQQQWEIVTNKVLPYRTKGPKRPVDRVSWNDANEFCRKLSKKSGTPYRLPSEAEWEYACRAGTQTPFHYGETITTELANYVGEHIYQFEPKGIYRHESTDVGSFPPNAFGLYDMHGNIWEWCADDWHDDYSGAPFDGIVWNNKDDPNHKVMRGGSWHEPPVNCRSATRLKMEKKEAEDLFGFRVAINNSLP